MLSRLLIRNYVLIDSLDIEFPEGLVIITGQTGAGKSIILGALSLLMGAKADASVIGESAENCVVEAEFDIDPDDEQTRLLLEENEAEWDDGHLIVRRQVNKSGRSRSFVNDSPVSVNVLQQMSAKLVDIHSQHQTLLLKDHSFQLDVLDHFAGNGGTLAECASEYKQWNALKGELVQLDERIARIERDKEYNQIQFDQLQAANVREGEIEALEQEQKALDNAEQIKEYLCAAENLFSSPDNSEIDFSVINSLKEIERNLEKASAFMPGLESLYQRVSEARVELDDVYGEVAGQNQKFEVSPERLQEVDDRLSLIYSLLSKHGCKSEIELIALRDELSQVLFDSTALVEKRVELEAAIKESFSRLSALSAQLHSSRVDAASKFATAIQDSIRYQELQSAVFEVDVLDAPQSSTGCDEILFRFSSTGRNAVDVAKCASGGEMSRIMLSLKDMMARYSKMPTMIFDEIDTGVSGSVADKMGTMICSMGKYMQVFAITHLPQVAAKGNAHYLVAKERSSDGRVISTIRRLSSEDRIYEVARMLSGSELTEAAVANAKSLLAQ